MNSEEVRVKILNLAVKMNCGHVASSLSTVEILLALFNNFNSCDKFILSKGHGCLGFYVMLRDKGLNPALKIHPDIDVSNGVECTTGSLGHGLPIGVGIALAKKFANEDGIIYVLMGDGECQEGTTWESVLIASNYGLDNLKIIIDHNKLQSLDRVDNILSLGDLEGKFFIFGCHTVAVDGHDITTLDNLLKFNVKGRPMVVIANTVKGKGIGFMEDKPEWHSRVPEGDVLISAYKDLTGE